MKPIGEFEEIDIEEWCKTIDINFTNQAYLIYHLLKSCRRVKSKVILFAGGGTNSAVKYYSSYTASKIAMIKLVELLDYEIDDIAFCILGPGWVKTKIHEETLSSSIRGTTVYTETERRIQNDDFTPLERVVESVEWLLNQDKLIIGGRNFSTVHDPWGSKELNQLLKKEPDAYKLRRYKNKFLQNE